MKQSIVSFALIIISIFYGITSAREVVIELPFTSRSDLNTAVELGFGIDYVKDGRIRGVIRDDNLARLENTGFEITIIAPDLRDLLPSLKLPDRGEYHSYTELTADFQALSTTYPDICRLFDIGTSVQGRTLWALEITDYPDSNEIEPEVRLIGAHHGNEDISVEVPYDIAHHLLENYSTDPDIANLVDNYEIWIIPMMNPDGLENGSRENANGVDLNRNYGYMRDSGDLSGAYSQPETKAIRDHALEHNFCFSLSYHSGAEYINYLWNYTPIRTPDDSYIEALSQAYDVYVDYGITEGYEWYQTKGDCNDWSYGTYGGMDWTIELSYDYEPPESQIDGILGDNRPAVLEFIEQSIQGIGGIVSDAATGDPLDATVNVVSLDWPVFTQLPLGDYHRCLPAGTYSVLISSPGYNDTTITGITVSTGQRTRLDVELTSNSNQQRHALRVVAVNSTNYNGAYPYPTHGHDALGAPDSDWFSLGKNGWAVLDLGESSTAVDRPGDDITVYEGASDGDEGFEVLVSMNYNGPWTSLGTGSGTTSFDMASAGIFEARYVYIDDDNVGSSSGTNPGFDLDAVEIILPPDEPYLVLVETSVNDPAPANGNGRLDPGENADLYITLKNVWPGDASAVAGSLSTSDSYLTITSDSSPYPDVPGGDTTTNSVGFGVSADAGTPQAHQAALELTVTASGGYEWTVPITLNVGQHELLYVDSDNEDTEARLTAALDAWGGTYSRWNTYSAGDVPLDTLLTYRTILWASGDQNSSSLNSTNQTNMATYLDQGGSLLFSGENYLSAYGGTSFTSDYLHVSSYETSISGSSVNGEAGDPIGDGISVTLDYPSGLAEYPDRINPDGSASVVFRMQGGSDPVAIRYPGTTRQRSYKVIFFAAPLEAFPTGGSDPDNIETVVARCLSWLGSGDDLTAPTAPTNVALASDGTLTWTASTDNIGVTGYRIYRQTVPYFNIGSLIPVSTITGTSVSFSGNIGDPSINYYFRVTACDAANNESSPSETVGEFDFEAE